MITQNQSTLKNISLNFEGSAEDYANIIHVLEFELANSKPKGVGLSAIQINIPLRVAIIRIKDKGINLFNSEIIKQEQPYTFKEEGCLSFPGKFINTKRYNYIKIRNGNGEEAVFTGFVACAIQHEICHWNGEVMYDYEAKNES